MSQRILIALDDSEVSLKVVEFAAKILSRNADITLFSVVPNVNLLCELDRPFIKGFVSKNYPDYCQSIEREKKRLLEDSLQTGKQILLEASFQENRIAIKIETVKDDISLSILDEVRNGYDLIVLGRRGHSVLKKFLLGSVSQKVLQAAKDVSILIVE